MTHPRESSNDAVKNGTHIGGPGGVVAAGVAHSVRAGGEKEAPQVIGAWTGTWGVYSPGQTAQKAPPMRLDSKVERKGDRWQATFEGECGRPYKYTIRMNGRQAGGVVLFKGTADLGEKDGGVYDW